MRRRCRLYGHDGVKPKASPTKWSSSTASDQCCARPWQRLQPELWDTLPTRCGPSHLFFRNNRRFRPQKLFPTQSSRRNYYLNISFNLLFGFALCIIYTVLWRDIIFFAKAAKCADVRYKYASRYPETGLISTEKIMKQFNISPLFVPCEFSC